MKSRQPQPLVLDEILANPERSLLELPKVNEHADIPVRAWLQSIYQSSQQSFSI